VKEGGIIYHNAPANGYLNHGFYQMQPTLFMDYYRENGWPYIVLEMAMDGTEKEMPQDINRLIPWNNPTWRYYKEQIPKISTLNVLARRIPGATLDKMPVQSKYRKA
jgi:hypothetical protein